MISLFINGGRFLLSLSNNFLEERSERLCFYYYLFLMETRSQIQEIISFIRSKRPPRTGDFHSYFSILGNLLAVSVFVLVKEWNGENSFLLLIFSVLFSPYDEPSVKRDLGSSFHSLYERVVL